MNRVHTYKNNDAVQSAFKLIPKEIHPLLKCDWLIGVSPIVAGLHKFQDAGYNRSFHNTAHVVYPNSQCLPDKERRTTLVLPCEGVEPWTVVHELGHILDEKLGFRYTPDPVTWYAETNRYEAFAEAFTAFCVKGYVAKDLDRDTIEMFQSLGRV